MPIGEVTGATQRACSTRSGCSDHADVAGRNDKQDQSADQAVEPTGPGRWRAGGSGDIPGAEGGLLASLKPMILQLVKEAAQQAVQELLGSGFSCSGQASSAGSQPMHNSEQPNKPRRKPKGKGTGDRPPVQTQRDSSTSKGGKTGGKGKSVAQDQPEQQVEAGVEDRARQASLSRLSNRKRALEKASQMRKAGFRSAAKLQMKISDFCHRIGTSLCLNLVASPTH